MLSLVGAKKLHSFDTCHFDPLLKFDIGLFGQAGNAQRELDNLGVGEGDLFLFFGWFRDFQQSKKADYHHIFGCLQVDEVIKDQIRLENSVKCLASNIHMLVQMKPGIRTTRFLYPTQIAR